MTLARKEERDHGTIQETREGYRICRSPDRPVVSASAISPSISRPIRETIIRGEVF